MPVVGNLLRMFWGVSVTAQDLETHVAKSSFFAPINALSCEWVALQSEHLFEWLDEVMYI